MGSHLSDVARSNSTSTSLDEPVDAEAVAYDAACAAREEENAWARKLRLHVDDLRVFRDNGISLETLETKTPSSRQRMLAYLKKNCGPVPVWIQISGLYPESKNGGGLIASPESRRKRVRALYKATMLLVRRALARHDVDPDRAERSVFWDPIAQVCRDLEIAPSKLSALLKEHAGHSLAQMIDNVRADRVRKTLRGGIRRFVGEMRGRTVAGDAAHGACSGTELDEWAVWKELKASRKWPEFSQNTWANELGFASYRRLYRACVSVYGKTPHQLEMELIREVLAESATEAVQVDVPDYTEWNVKEAEEAVRGIRAYEEG